MLTYASKPTPWKGKIKIEPLKSSDLSKHTSWCYQNHAWKMLAHAAFLNNRENQGRIPIQSDAPRSERLQWWNFQRGRQLGASRRSRRKQDKFTPA